MMTVFDWLTSPTMMQGLFYVAVGISLVWLTIKKIFGRKKKS